MDDDVKMPIAVTMGDPAGVGPELCLRILRNEDVRRLCVPVVFGDVRVLERVAGATGLPAPDRRMTLEEWRDQATPFEEGLVVDLANAGDVVASRVDEATGRASYDYVEAAIESALAGTVLAVVTNPIHKEALKAAGVPFPGHTELLAARTGARRACMMLTSDELTCSFVTTHVGYRDVPSLLTTDRILDVIELTVDALRRIRGGAPRLLTCGLNPHAGEHGLFGAGEEEKIIAPAVEAARAKGIDVEGPVPPDTAFVVERRRVTDGYICMYHDQGHIPLKALAFDTAVNVTLGLPIVRTSVDHGTALDIAWTGKARSTSLERAVALAVRLATVRASASKYEAGIRERVDAPGSPGVHDVDRNRGGGER